jgi:activator of HSP90 ATPase
MSNHIHQEVTIAAPPARVFAALTHGAEFGALTGAPAEIDASAGGAFSCFGGMIHGRTLELDADRLLVQAWRVKLWEEGLYSTVRFVLEAVGDGTKITLDHRGFPEGNAEHLASGWHANYWEPLGKKLG